MSKAGRELLIFMAQALAKHANPDGDIARTLQRLVAAVEVERVASGPVE